MPGINAVTIAVGDEIDGTSEPDEEVFDSTTQDPADSETVTEHEEAGLDDMNMCLDMCEETAVTEYANFVRSSMMI